MIKLIEGLPDAVVGLEAIGGVESADYDRVAAPAVKHALERHGKIRVIHVLDDRFPGYTAGGGLKDAMLGLAHPRSFERIAVVTNSDSIHRLVTVAGWSIPGRTEAVPKPAAQGGGGLGHRRPRRTLIEAIEKAPLPGLFP
jgi:hypothetical protein